MVAQKKKKKVGGWAILHFSIAGVILFASPALAVPITDVTIPLNAGSFYTYTGPPGDTAGSLQILDFNNNNTFRINLAIMKAEGDTAFNYQLYNSGVNFQTTFNLGPSAMYDDYSAYNNPANPDPARSIAKGSFREGAVLTLYGWIRNKKTTEKWGPFNILTAVVQDDFAIEESSLPSTNQLIFQQHFRVTGGELATGSVTGLTLSNFTATYQFNGCTQSPNSGVQDFQNTIYRASNSQVQFLAVPEPMSIILLSTAGLLLSLKRNGKKKDALYNS
jgi:hypothetical protein